MPAADGDLLHGDHGVAAQGQYRPGHGLDAAGALAQGELRIARRLNCLDGETALARTHGGTVQRDAIHGDAIKRRLIALAIDVLAQYCAGTLHQWQRLDRQTRQILADQSISLRRDDESRRGGVSLRGCRCVH